MPRLPSLKALMAFEAAARLGSFTKAAKELNTTQSAISHLMRTLEDSVGQPLFNRRHRGAVTTDAGSDLRLTVLECLERLSTGFQRLEQYRKPNQIIVSAPRSFADAVLLPRLATYRAMHPDHNVWLESGIEPPDPVLGEVYVTVSRGHRNVPGLDPVFLCSDRLTPVAAPATLNRLDVRRPADLVAAPLLYDERREDWDTWFRLAGVDAALPVDGWNFSDSGLLLEASRQGLGVALGSLTLAGDLIGSGDLVAPFPDLVVSGPGYFVLSSDAAMALERVRSFRDWLFTTCSDLE